MERDSGPGRKTLNRIFRMAPILVAWSISLVAVLSLGLPVVTARATIDRRQAVPTNASLLRADIGWESPGRGDEAAVIDQTARDAAPQSSAEKIRTFQNIDPSASYGAGTLQWDNSSAGPTPEHQGSADPDSVVRLLSAPTPANGGVDQSPQGHTPDHPIKDKLAQFQWPPPPTQPKPQEQPGKQKQPGQQEQYAPHLGAPPRPVTQFLKYQYSFGSESDILYRRNRDLNDQVKDNSLIAVPQINGMIVYRPTAWLETTLEMTLDREIPLQEEKVVTLPNGEIQYAQERHFSLLVDQVFVTLKSSAVPIELTAGRRNYEDERHWLYDTSMDIVRAQLKLGAFRVEGTYGREVLVDLDLTKQEVPDRINTAMLYAEFRGIEDTKLAVYTISRNDRAHKEGHPIHIGARALSTPSDNFNFWFDGAYLGGRDESSQRISAAGLDLGATYQFKKLPFSPSVTLGYAFGSGDGDPKDNKNRAFHQTGLQSNERRFAGLADFKYYGEGFDPELSNLQIFTAGLGFRPMPNVSVDLVYHRYRLHKVADTIRNSALTAEINQDDTQLTRDVGDGFDIVVGFRNLFGVRRLGLDLRAGWFFPGKAYRIQGGDPDNPTFRSADNGVGAIAKFWY